MGKILFSSILNETLREYDELDAIIKTELTKYIIENRELFDGFFLSYNLDLYNSNDDYVYIYCMEKSGFITRCMNYIKKCLGLYIYGLGGSVGLDKAENLNFLYNITDINAFRKKLKEIMNSKLTEELHNQINNSLFNKAYHGNNSQLVYQNKSLTIKNDHLSISFHNGTGKNNWVSIESKFDAGLDELFYSFFNDEFDSSLFSDYFLERLVSNKNNEFDFHVENIKVKKDKLLTCSFINSDDNSKKLILR